MKLKSILVTAFVIVIIIFSIQNAEITKVKILFWEFFMSRSLIIIGSFSLGILAGLLIFMKRSLIQKKHNN